MAADWTPTPHLIEKMNARNVTWAEIVDILDHPEVVYGPDARGRRVHQKDDLSVVASKNGDVITVLLRQTDEWTNEDAQERSRP